MIFAPAGLIRIEGGLDAREQRQDFKHRRNRYGGAKAQKKVDIFQVQARQYGELRVPDHVPQTEAPAFLVAGVAAAAMGSSFFRIQQQELVLLSQRSLEVLVLARDMMQNNNGLLLRSLVQMTQRNAS